MTTRTCAHCGGAFQGRNRSKPSCCSKRCQRLRWYYANHEAGKAANAAYKRRERARCNERERLRKAGIRDEAHPQFVERVDRDIVYAMHGGGCGICRQYVPPDEFEIDHRVPLSRGGLHGYVNVQPSHPPCNRRKYNHMEAST